MDTVKVRITIAALIFVCLLPCFAHAELKPMNDKELRGITGMGGIDISQLGPDTARFYFDIHAEIYAEIDSIKLGYYHREDLTTRKYLAPDDPHVVDNGNGTFNLLDDNNQVVKSNVPYFVHIDTKGHAHEIPFDDNDFYQYKYNNTFEPAYVDGRQGTNDVSLLGEKISSVRTKNTNYLDWDINLENVRLGESKANPVIIDGLVVHLKYDDINSPDKKLTDIIIGTNSLVGKFYGDFKRVTGYVSGKLVNHTRVENAILDSALIGEFNEAPVPVSMKRDSFLMLVDEYEAAYGDADHPPVPGDPTNNNIHTGAFLRVGLNPTSEHFGYAVVAGFNEIVANSYEPQGIHLENAIRNWWPRQP